MNNRSPANSKDRILSYKGKFWYEMYQVGGFTMPLTSTWYDDKGFCLVCYLLHCKHTNRTTHLNMESPVEVVDSFPEGAVSLT
jgi:hypothetical protein